MLCQLIYVGFTPSALATKLLKLTNRLKSRIRELTVHVTHGKSNLPDIYNI